MRRAMWRELETWPGWNCEPTAQIERVRVATLHLQQARQFSTLPGSEQPNRSSGAAGAPRWTAQLLSPRGSLTQRRISTIRCRLKSWLKRPNPQLLHALVQDRHDQINRHDNRPRTFKRQRHEWVSKRALRVLCAFDVLALFIVFELFKVMRTLMAERMSGGIFEAHP